MTKPSCIQASGRPTPAALFALPALALGFFAASCDVFAGLTPPPDSGAPLVHMLEDADFSLALSALEAGRQAHIVFTTGAGGSNDKVTVTAGRVSAGSGQPGGRSYGVAERASEERRAAFRSSLSACSPPAPRSLDNGLAPRGLEAYPSGNPADDVPGKKAQFALYGDQASTTSPATQATCRYVARDIAFGERTRSLSIWVADPEWSDTETDPGKVTPGRVEALARAFFNPDGDTDASIYSWVSTMLGDEWGPGGPIRSGFASYPVIDPSGNITILLADIDSDKDAFIKQGGVVGYFYPGDTMPGSSWHNGRVMFTVDSVMLGTAEGASWEISDRWPSMVISTLAHEFQHLVHFYQKGVLRGGNYFGQATWIDELCSMLVEDLLADKLGLPGPRGIAPDDGTAGRPGITGGRLPEFLLWPDRSPGDWDEASGDELTSYYSWAYAFGAYLGRNYGGADFVRRVVQTGLANESAIVVAAATFTGRSESMPGLLRRWGAATLLSARADAPEGYRYNTGAWFVSQAGGREYRLGSINMYNYLYPRGIDSDGDGLGDTDLARPYTYSLGNADGMPGGAYTNAFLDLGDSRGKPWAFTLPEGRHATLVVD